MTRFQVCQGSERHFVSSIENVRRSEGWFVVDDVNVGEDILQCLSRFLDKYYRSEIHRNRSPNESGFRLFATMCPSESYPERLPLPGSFTRRWPAYKVLGTPTELDQAEYLKWVAGIRDDLAARIVTVT